MAVEQTGRRAVPGPGGAGGGDGRRSRPLAEVLRGDEAYIRYARKYSYSDRCRYYWPVPKVQEALARLLSNLSERPTPSPLLSQYLPVQYVAIREGRLTSRPVDLVHDKIMEVTACYAAACGEE